MKIAISGPVGSGKTTLAMALAEARQLTILPEGMTGIVEAKRRLSVAGTANWRERAIQQKNALRHWMKAHEEWFEDRARLLRRTPDAVADRSDLDVLASWLVFFSGQPDQGATARLVAATRGRMQAYDAVVLLPPRTGVVEAENEDGLKRQQSAVAHWLHYTLVQGLAAETGTSLLILAPDGSVEDRVAEVLGRIG